MRLSDAYDGADVIGDIRLANDEPIRLAPPGRTIATSCPDCHTMVPGDTFGRQCDLCAAADAVNEAGRDAHDQCLQDAMLTFSDVIGPTIDQIEEANEASQPADLNWLRYGVAKMMRIDPDRLSVEMCNDGSIKVNGEGLNDAETSRLAEWGTAETGQPTLVASATGTVWHAL